MEEYLTAVHKYDVLSIVRAASVREVPFRTLDINLNQLKEQNLHLFKKLCCSIWTEIPKWLEALNKLQKELIDSKPEVYRELKEDFPITFINMPQTSAFAPTSNWLWKFVSLKGNVIRTRERGKREVIQEYKCRKCKCSQLIYAHRLLGFHFDVPTKCNNSECKGTVYNVVDPSGGDNLNYFVDFQEISVQLHDQQGLQMPVELERELVGSCFIGDQITICGTFETRSKKNDNDSHRLTLRAAGIQVHENQQKMNIDPDEMNFEIRADWSLDMEQYGDELIIRDQMIASTAPELEGLSLPKLGLLLILCSGGTNSESEIKMASATTREICHFLVIGDPGMGKSQLLKAAAEISINSVRAVGYATTTAGLTAHCYKDDGDYQVEAGALVKANNGVCCIDEINLMTKEHRGAIHEVMESQRITIAKAGIKTELSTKCSIIAGMNQKNSTLPLDETNFSLEGSLRSRFDLIFELTDPKDPELDMKIMMHILGHAAKKTEEPSWSLNRLQMHLLVAKNIKVQMSDAVSTILAQYYRFCSRHEDIDKSRNTMRLWQSLERLTICHAKLMLRSKTKIIDAVTVVMMMESSWSFGYLMAPLSVIQAHVPLGPSDEYVNIVLQKLSLQDLKDDLEPSASIQTSAHQSQPKLELTQDDIDRIFADSEEDEPVNKPASLGKVSINDELKDQGTSEGTQSLFQARPFKSFDNNLSDEEMNFTQPPSTSTQNKRPTSPIDEFISRKPKVQTLQPIITDPIINNLNLLNALLCGGARKEEKLVKLAPAEPTTLFSKLSKFQFKDDAPTSETSETSMDDPTKIEDSLPNEPQAEQKQKTFIDDCDFDPFGELEF